MAWIAAAAGLSRVLGLESEPATLYERSPMRFWQGVAVLLALALLLSLLLLH